MFEHRRSVALTFVYLILSGPNLAIARRVVAQINGTSGAELTLVSELEQDSQWCNPISRMRTKYYKFEVLESGENCKVGSCTSYELVRDKTTPVLKVHHGQSWAVKFAEEDESGSDDLLWTHVKGRGRAWNEDLNIYDAEYVAYGEANPEEGLREYVEFKWASGKTTRVAGGMFYQGGLVRRGLDKVAKEQKDVNDVNDVTEIGKEGVRTSNIVAHDAKKGAKYVAGGAALTATGFALASFAQGIALSNTALLGAALATTLGGAVVGAALGAGIGAVVGIAGLVGLVKLLRNKGLSGAEKMWEKLYCMDFTVCYTRAKKDKQYVTLMVINGKECPAKPKDEE